MREVITIAKALADGSRMRALLGLRKQELCVCQLIELLGLASSTVSKHMSILYQARLVDSRKDGRWVHYRLADENASDEVRGALEWVLASLSQDPEIQRDAERLENIVKVCPEELWREQGKAPKSRTSRRKAAEPA